MAIFLALCFGDCVELEMILKISLPEEESMLNSP